MADLTVPEKVRTGADFSPDRRYRYSLWREWAGWDNLRALVVIGLNPSTADETVDDPTIRRCIGFARREGCGRLVMINLFAFRATDPRELMYQLDPVGPENDLHIQTWTRPTLGHEPIVVAAWGALGRYRNRSIEVRNLITAMHLWCFGTTQGGHPRHPLYLRADAPLVRYS